MASGLGMRTENKMAAETPNSEDVLCREILAEARRTSEQIIRNARAEAEATLGRVAAVAATEREGKLKVAHTEAARRKDSVWATILLATERLRSTRIETLLERIFNETNEALLARQAFDYQKALVNLATAAMKRMDADEFVIRLSPNDRGTSGPRLAEQILAEMDRTSLRITVMDEPAITAGLIVEDTQGRQVWDNQLTERLKRMWPELRRQIANNVLCPPPTASYTPW